MRTVIALAAIVAIVAAGCAKSNNAQQTVTGKQTIVFATQGLGTEGQASTAQIAAFEKANPNITVQVLTLSPTADNAYQQLTQRFVAGSATPDVITADVIWPATFARAGWIAPLDSFNPDLGSFFQGQVKAGQYKGKTYAIPWFINAEGIYYRKDLVPSPPKSPADLVQAAKSAMQKDPSLKEGFAFEGDKYEGVVTAFVNFLGGFGGKLDPSNIDTPANRQALQFMHDTIYKDKVTPQAATGWQESQVQDAWTSGQAAFAMNWPYVFALPAEKPMLANTGWIPFPSQSGSPAAALGGDMLAVNAKSAHKAAAWKFIQFLAGETAQIQRAVAAGDPPALQSAYNQKLFTAAPYFKDETAVYKVATSRPVDPNYKKISDALQTMLSSVLSNQTSPQQALSAAAPQVKAAASGG